MVKEKINLINHRRQFKILKEEVQEFQLLINPTLQVTRPTLQHS